MLLPDVSQATAAKVAERLRQAVESSVVEPVGRVTISAGVALWPQHSRDPMQVLKGADQQLYAAKAAGRNRVMLASGDAVEAED